MGRHSMIYVISQSDREGEERENESAIWSESSEKKKVEEGNKSSKSW